MKESVEQANVPIEYHGRGREGEKARPREMPRLRTIVDEASLCCWLLVAGRFFLQRERIPSKQAGSTIVSDLAFSQRAGGTIYFHHTC